MTTERDFIRKHPNKKSSELIPLAKAAGMTLTPRLIGKVRYYDRKKERDGAFASKTPRAQVDSVLKKHLDAEKATTNGRYIRVAPKTKRKPAPAVMPVAPVASIRKLATSIEPFEHQFLVLADEIGYERSRELLDAWRESVRRVVAGL